MSIDVSEIVACLENVKSWGISLVVFVVVGENGGNRCWVVSKPCFRKSTPSSFPSLSLTFLGRYRLLSFLFPVLDRISFLGSVQTDSDSRTRAADFVVAFGSP